MASLKLPLVLFFACSLFLQGTLGEIICEDLPADVCAFAISTSGKRCLLENHTAKDGKMECKTSAVVVHGMSEYIETDQCVDACGVQRNTVGISSDSLLEPQFISKLCSANCHQNCPNIVELYFNLAAGEGVLLPDLCERNKLNPRRAMVELLSNGAAPGPVSFESRDLSASSIASAPAPSPI